MTKRLLQIIIEVDKKDSSFVYFTLEANEGLCFYSTLDHLEGDQTRKIDIHLTESLKNEFLTVFNYLKSQLDINIVQDFTEID